MSHLVSYLERMFWGIGSLAIGLIILFAVLHLLKQNAITGGVASWVGQHAQNY